MKTVEYNKSVGLVVCTCNVPCRKRQCYGWHCRSRGIWAQKPKDSNTSGIYQLKCNTCNNAYIGQSSRPITIRHKEHLRYVRNNNPTSAYALHILDNRHEFGLAEETLKLLKPCTKGMRMNCWEVLFMHIHCKYNILNWEEQVTDTNPLFDLARIPRDLQCHP